MSNKKKSNISKADKIIFESYERAINNRMKAGKDVTLMTKRLNKLLEATNK